MIRDDPPQSRIWEYFGGVIVDIPVWETGEALARGIIESSYSGWPYAIPCCGHLGFNYVGDHISRAQIGSTVLANVDAWNALPQEYIDLYWDILYNEFPAQAYAIRQADDDLSELKYYTAGGQEGTGGEMIHQPDEGWALPYLQAIKDNMWPDLIQSLDDKGYDGKYWLKWYIELGEKHGVMVPEFLKEGL